MSRCHDFIFEVFLDKGVIHERLTVPKTLISHSNIYSHCKINSISWRIWSKGAWKEVDWNNTLGSINSHPAFWKSYQVHFLNVMKAGIRLIELIKFELSFANTFMFLCYMFLYYMHMRIYKKTESLSFTYRLQKYIITFSLRWTKVWIWSLSVPFLIITKIMIRIAIWMILGSILRSLDL